MNISKTVEVAPLPTPIDKVNGGISVNMAYLLGGVAYFAAPDVYMGNKLSAYGSSLNYTVNYKVAQDGMSCGRRIVLGQMP